MTSDRERRELRRNVSAMTLTLREAEQLATQSVPPGPHNHPAFDRLVVAVHRRVRRLARAILLTLDAGFPHEAAILGRSLFEDSLRLGVLASADAVTRTGLIASWMVNSMSHAETMLREGERGGAFDPAERAAVLAERRTRIELAAKQYGVKGKWPRFGSEAQMAKQLNRRDELRSYLFASQVTHGAETSFFFDRDPVGDNERDGLIAAPLDEVAGAALVLAAFGILRGHIASAKILGWPGGDQAQHLLDRPIR
jgi:hypothetical protein